MSYSKKRATIPVLILLVFFPITFGFSGGLGSLAEPWEISTCLHLTEMNLTQHGNYTVTTDIDCGESTVYSRGGNTGYCGDRVNYFDGLNHTISNLYCNSSATAELGIIQLVQPGGTFRQLRLVNHTVYNPVRQLIGTVGVCELDSTIEMITVQDSQYWGDQRVGVCGNSKGATLRKIESIDNNFYASSVGGMLIGQIEDNNQITTIEQIRINSSMILGANREGGIIGRSYSYVNMKHIEQKGTLNTTNAFDVGGLIGHAVEDLVNVEQTIVTKNILGTQPESTRNMGAFIGNNQAGLTFTEAYYDNQNINKTACGVGCLDQGGLSTTALTTPNTFTNWNSSVWNFTTGEYPTLIYRFDLNYSALGQPPTNQTNQTNQTQQPTNVTGIVVEATDLTPLTQSLEKLGMLFAWLILIIIYILARGSNKSPIHVLGFIMLALGLIIGGIFLAQYFLLGLMIILSSVTTLGYMMYSHQ